jgi:hypothetical protein
MNWYSVPMQETVSKPDTVSCFQMVVAGKLQLGLTSIGGHGIIEAWYKNFLIGEIIKGK